MTRVRRLLTLLALLAGFAVPAAPAVAGGDTSALAINTKDGTSLFKFAFEVRKTMSEVVDETNTAFAYNNCTGCRAVAVSFQVVLVMADASTVTPTNVAVAINENCTLCDAAAFAYQFVVGTNGPVSFTKEGRDGLKELRKRLAGLGEANLSDADLAAELDDIAGELAGILTNELDAAGAPDRDGEDDAEGQPAEAVEGETPTPDPTEVPEETVTPEGEELEPSDTPVPEDEVEEEPEAETQAPEELETEEPVEEEPAP